MGVLSWGCLVIQRDQGYTEGRSAGKPVGERKWDPHTGKSRVERGKREGAKENYWDRCNRRVMC